MLIKVTCASINLQKLNEDAMEMLSNASLANDASTIAKIKDELGFPVEQLAVIEKCNAVMIVIAYYGEYLENYIHSRLLDTWDKLSHGGVINSVRHIKFFDNRDAIHYLGECVLGLHSVTLGDSQVLAQVTSALQVAAQIQPSNPTFSFMANWFKDLSSEVKLRTSLFDGNISLERIATDFIAEHIQKDGKVTIVGYGRSGKLVSKILSEELHYNIQIANRTPNILKHLSPKSGVIPVSFQDYNKILDVDCVVIALSSNGETQKYCSEMLLICDELKKKPKLFIDLATPPLMSKNTVPYLINIEDLSTVAHKNLDKRISEVAKARDIVNKSSNTFIETLNKEISALLLDEQREKVNCKIDPVKLELFKFRNDVYKFIRDYLDKLDFVEVNTPCIVGVSTDPPKVDKGGTLDVSWPGGNNAFLRQSNQLYKQMIVASGLPKIYEIGPFWRAETTPSYRHLQESIGLDVEYSNPKNLEEVYRLAYEIILEVKNHIFKHHDIKRKNLLLPRFDSLPIFTYEEAVKLLNSKGYALAFGEDIGLMGEAKLGQIVRREYNSDALIIKDYPDTIKKFYTKKSKGGLTETFDVIICGWEFVSGAVRETNRDLIEKSMKLSGINIRNYNFYLSIVDGAVPHGGFCLGLDRLVAKLLDHEMITDAVVFPRSFKTLIP